MAGLTLPCPFCRDGQGVGGVVGVGARLFWHGFWVGTVLPCPFCRAGDVPGLGGTVRPLWAVILGKTAESNPPGLGHGCSAAAFGWDGAAVPNLPGGRRRG